MIIEKELRAIRYQIQCDKCKRIEEPYDVVVTEVHEPPAINFVEKLARISGWDTVEGHVCGDCLDAEYYSEQEKLDTQIVKIEEPKQ